MKKLVLLLTAATLLLAFTSCGKDAPVVDKDVPITKITINVDHDQRLEVECGEYFSIGCTVEPANATETVKWTVENEKVISLFSSDDRDRSARFLAIGPEDGQLYGISNIIVESESGEVSDRIETGVGTPDIKVLGAVLDNKAVKLVVGESMVLQVTCRPRNADYKEIKWSVKDQSILEEDYSEDIQFNGTAMKDGTTQVIVDVDGMRDTCEVTVWTPSLPAPAVSVTGIKLAEKTFNVTLGESFDVVATVIPANARHTGVTFEYSNPIIIPEMGIDGVSGIRFRATAVGMTTIRVYSQDDPSVKADALVYVSMPQPPANVVDLGFRSESTGAPTYFATMNLGAKVPEDPGDLFAWGDPEVHYLSKQPLLWKDGKAGGYIQENYKWYNPYSKSMKKYGDVDKVYALTPEDDPATVALGECWHTPLPDEMFWLKNNCKWESVMTGGVYGYRLTSTVPGFTSKSIFLPATGYMMEEWDGYGFLDIYLGHYMTCLLSYQVKNGTLVFDSDTDCNFTFSQKKAQKRDVYFLSQKRFAGQAIRPVWRL